MMNNKMSLRKVKGDFNRIFDKTLTDLVRGIRNNKENEVGLMFGCSFVCQLFPFSSRQSTLRSVWRRSKRSSGTTVSS